MTSTSARVPGGSSSPRRARFTISARQPVWSAMRCLVRCRPTSKRYALEQPTARQPEAEGGVVWVGTRGRQGTADACPPRHPGLPGFIWNPSAFFMTSAVIFSLSPSTFLNPLMGSSAYHGACSVSGAALGRAPTSAPPHLPHEFWSDPVAFVSRARPALAWLTPARLACPCYQRLRPSARGPVCASLRVL